MRVLIVDDTPANASMLADYLQAKGFTVDIAATGMDAVRLACEGQPDVVLMDVQMPGMDGLEATRRIRQDPRGRALPIVMLTAMVMPGDRDRSLAAGASEFVSKPAPLASIAALVTQLGRRRDGGPA